MMRRSHIAITALSLALFVLSACRSKQANYADKPFDQEDTTSLFRKEGHLAFIKPDSQAVSIAIEIADDDSTRHRGMMERASMPDKSGMLFVFPSPEQSGFWMANTPLSLDIIFVSPDSEIVDIAKYTKPLSSKNVNASAPYQFVVEVPAGFSDTHGLVTGNRVRWARRK